MAFLSRNERASPSQQAVGGPQKLLTMVLQRASTAASTKLHRMALRGTGLTRRLAEPMQASRGGFQSAIDFHGLIERGPFRQDTSCRTLTCSGEAVRKAARWSARGHCARDDRQQRPPSSFRSTRVFPTQPEYRVCVVPVNGGWSRCRAKYLAKTNRERCHPRPAAVRGSRHHVARMPEPPHEPSRPRTSLHR